MRENREKQNQLNLTFLEQTKNAKAKSSGIERVIDFFRFRTQDNETNQNSNDIFLQCTLNLP